ncbi:MAG: glycosyltransferase family 4 protein [Candidatus Eisenbacteria sp.]|nr:glycosyltransferase family 4 protein [Candidatus Eisenbacteria bacterium]
MTILAVYGADYPWDVRVEKLLSGFLTHGYEIHLVCRNLARRPSRERVDGFICHRILGPRLGQLLHRALTLPAPANPLWRRVLARAIDATCPDLLLVRDLPLAPLVVAAGRRAGLPVVVDMAENHPAMWRNVIASDPLPLRSWLLKNPPLARRMERRVACTADAIFVVVEEMRMHLIAKGAPPERVHVVSNTPPRRVLERAASDPGRGEGALDLVYVGYITRSRGLQQVLKAMALVQDNSVTIRFHIVGTGGYVTALKAQTRELGLESRVVFHGWVQPDKVPALMERCNAGIIPHLKTEHTNTTVPNKLFDYMAVGIPVIVSDADPLHRIVGEEKCGLSFRSGRPDDLAGLLRRLADPEVRRRFGVHGRTAVRERLHWERDFDVALRVVKRLAGRSATGGR